MKSNEWFFIGYVLVNIIALVHLLIKYKPNQEDTSPNSYIPFFTILKVLLYLFFLFPAGIFYLTIKSFEEINHDKWAKYGLLICGLMSLYILGAGVLFFYKNFFI